MKRFWGSALMVLALLAGCGSNAGSEYIGKWVSVKNGNRTLEIERNGESFMIRNTEPSFINGKVETNNIPGTLKDGVLQLSVGFGTISLAIDKASGNLTDGKAEYKRAN